MLLKLMATFGLTTTTAGSLALLIVAAYNAGTLTLRGAAVLIAGTGVVGVGLALILLISYPYLVKKIKSGEKALQAF